MNIPETPQLMLSFEPSPEKGQDFLLRVTRSEREFFVTAAEERETYPVQLPRLFQETVFLDDGGWRHRRRSEAPARELGLRIWKQLPPSLAGEIRSGTPTDPRRVAIVSRSSGVDDVPWEWLNTGQGPESVIAAAGNVRFIRLVPCRYASPPLTVTPPLRILTVMTNPKDERLLNPFVERSVIMGSVEGNPAYEVRDLFEPRVDALYDALKWSPHIVHYVGHAGRTGPSGAIILHDERDGTRWVAATELSKMLPSSVQLLCLSTTVTAPNYDTGGLVRIAHSPSDISLPTTIVNQYILEPDTASTFWGEFYAALLQHEGDVVEAFHGARARVFAGAGDTWSWASFSLVVRDGTGFPLRIAQGMTSKQRFAAEIQAQWSTRLANTLATRMSTLKPEVQKTLAETIDSEEKRIDSYRGEIEKF